MTLPASHPPEAHEHAREAGVVRRPADGGQAAAQDALVLARQQPDRQRSRRTHLASGASYALLQVLIRVCCASLDTTVLAHK